MSKRLTRRVAAIAAAALGVVAIGGTALAGHLGDVDSYTGCLVPKDGVIVKVKEGNAPASPCTGGMTQVHLSGGDITKISVTGALTGGGDSGEITIGLKPEFTLPTGCTSGQVAKWNGTGWACAADNNTTYTAGTGLDLSAGNAFSIEPAYRVKNTPDCASGQFATGFDGDGDIQCAAPASTGVQGFSASAGGVLVAGTTTIISKTLPAGSYLLFAHVDGDSPIFDGDEWSSGTCNIPGDSASLTIPEAFDLDEFSLNSNMTLVSAVSHSGGALLLTCTETKGNFDVAHATLTALKVDSLG